MANAKRIPGIVRIHGPVEYSSQIWPLSQITGGQGAHLIDQINNVELRSQSVFDWVLFFIGLTLGRRLGNVRNIGAGNLNPDFVGYFDG